MGVANELAKLSKTVLHAQTLGPDEFQVYLETLDDPSPEISSNVNKSPFFSGCPLKRKLKSLRNSILYLLEI